MKDGIDEILESQSLLSYLRERKAELEEYARRVGNMDAYKDAARFRKQAAQIGKYIAAVEWMLREITDLDKG